MDKLELKPINLAALAAITGIFGGVVILAISLIVGYSWVYAVVGLTTTGGITWLLLMNRYLSWASGDASRPSQDGQLTRMVYPAETTRIEITANDPSGQFSSGRFAELPITLDQLIKVARRLDAGVSFSHAGLAGPGRPLSRSEFESLRDKMIVDGLAYWINPASHAQGVELTRGGQAMIQYFTRFIPKKKPTPQRPGTYRPARQLSSNAHAHTRTRGNGREAAYKRLTD